MLAALAFLVLGAARPQAGAKLVQVERRGIDAVIALDVSLSMDATDVLPSRLERSKQEIRELLNGLRGDRVGILIFSGSSFPLCPMTLDVAAANLFLDAVRTDVLPDPGTNLEEALRGARSMLDAELGETRGRAVILFTDGESHLGDALAAARTLKDDGVPVLTVGVGTPNGEPIPIFDAQGALVGYKKDRAGAVVLSRLDEALLGGIAGTTGGNAFPATLQGREVGEILRFLDRMERGELGGTQRRRVEERFQIPVGIGTALLLLAAFVPEARRRRPAEPGEVEGKPARGRERA
jgi:Ca-activated chloride channel family protein